MKQKIHENWHSKNDNIFTVNKIRLGIFYYLFFHAPSARCRGYNWDNTAIIVVELCTCPIDTSIDDFFCHFICLDHCMMIG